MKRICPRCNEPLFSNCYVKDKGINTLSYLELIKKKIKKSNHVIVQNVVMLNFMLTLMIQINIIIMMMI